MVGAQVDAGRMDDPAARMLGSRLLPSWRRARARDGELHASGVLHVGTAPDHVRALQAGFRAMWSEWRKLATRWVHEPTSADVMPWAALAEAPARFLVRPTATYGLLTQRLLQPDALEDIRVFDVLTDMLANGGTETATRPANWATCEAERQAMFRLDVPAFSYRANTRHLHACDGTRIDDVFTEPPAQRWRKRLEHLASDDGAREGERAAALIERTLMPVAPPQPRTGKAGAEEIARHLVASALSAPDGAPTWIGYEHDPAGNMIVPALASDGLYHGRCGIALFLLAAGAECPAGAEMAARVFDALAAAAPRETADPGWAHGMAGRAIALQAAARLAQRPSWADAARRLAATLAENARAIASASANASATWPQRDLFSGEAGLVLALARDGAHLDAARLLTSRWEKWLAGVSRRQGLAHGASGLAVAAGRLALAFARAGRLDEADDIWRDALRSLESGSSVDHKRSAATHHGLPALPGSWCDHQAGLALARATLVRCAAEMPSATQRDLERLRAELHNALLQVVAAPDTSLDLICCGNLGRIACLLLASDDDGAEARRRIDRWIARSAQQGWTLDGTPRDAWPAPGLFRGLAGAGLVLLATEDHAARALLAEIVGFAPFTP
jgi:lantibiotic modifying enzyme